MTLQAPLYYRLEPVFPKPPGVVVIASAAIVTCLATGRQLHHCGGPSAALGTDIVAALDMVRQGGKPAMIVDKGDWDDLRGCMQKLLTQIADAEFFINEEIGLTLEAAEQLIERTAS